MFWVSGLAADVSSSQYRFSIGSVSVWHRFNIGLSHWKPYARIVHEPFFMKPYRFACNSNSYMYIPIAYTKLIFGNTYTRFPCVNPSVGVFLKRVPQYMNHSLEADIQEDTSGCIGSLSVRYRFNIGLLSV